MSWYAFSQRTALQGVFPEERRFDANERMDYIDLTGARCLGGSGSLQFMVGLALTF